MQPLLILLPGLIGGVVLALLIRGTQRGTAPTFVETRLPAPSPSLINMAHIRVEGVGGLGMVGAVAVVALADSRVGFATAMALILGGGLALALIAARRENGSLPSSGDGPDDRSILHLEDESRSSEAAAAVPRHDWKSRWRAVNA